MKKPLLRPIMLALQGLALLAALPLGAQTTPGVDTSARQLADQARYWEDRGRYDLARDSWLKLLRVAPDDAAALAGAALAEAHSARSSAAQEYLERLRIAHPGDARIAEVEDAVRAGAYDLGRLDAPRALAQQGRYDEAAAAYRSVFNDQIPSGRLGLEYYQTLAGATNGWEPARAGLESLVHDYPDDPLYRLALAQHLTYEESSRREGIERLRQLSKPGPVSADARKAWRQALLWLDAASSDAPLFQAYLASSGDDAAIAARVAELRGVKAGGRVAVTPQQIRGQKVRAAFGLLDEGRLEEAAQTFQAILADSPNEDGALGGLGVVRLRQQRYGEARSLLEKATAASPATAGRWREALSSARFWERVGQAQAAHESGNPAAAEKLLRAAIVADPATARAEPSVIATLAGLLVEQGRTAEAEKLYRDVLARDPAQPQALQGLVGLLAGSDRLDEALRLASALTPEAQRELGGLGSLKAQALRDQAEVLRKGGDEAGAESLLRQALIEDPESAWTRLDLARLYQQQNRVREANTLVDGLLVGDAAMPDALYTKALLLSQQQSWYEALQVLEQIPPGSRTRPMADLQQRMWLRYQADRAAVFARYGRAQEAGALLAQLKPYAETSPEILGVLANGLVDMGQDGEALNYMRQALARKPDTDVGLRLQYASLLFKLRQDAEFEVVMNDLLRNRQLSDEQSLDLANLRVGFQLRQADLLREEGNLARSYEYLRPLMEANPDDPRVLMAVARLHADAGDAEQALALNQRVLQIDPENVDAYKGAIGAAASAGRNDVAQAYLDDAMQLAPESGQLYALAARVARARGDDGRAMQLYQQALRLERTRPSEGQSQSGFAPELQLIDPGTSSVYPPAGAPATAATVQPAPAWTGPAAAVESKQAVAAPWSAARPAAPLAAAPGAAPTLLAPALLAFPAAPATVAPPGASLAASDAAALAAPSRAIYPYVAAPRSAAAAQAQEADQITREIGEIQAQRSPTLGLGVSFRNRDGTEGLDRLYDFEMPVELSVPAVDAGRFRLRVVPVYLDAGALEGTALASFGTLALVDDDTLSFDQNDTGVALGAAYEAGSFHADFGSSPLGFGVETLVGGVNWRPSLDHWSFKLDLARRSVSDSLLSYAGALDPGLGRYWGGVTRNGGRFDLAYDFGGMGVYGNLGYYIFDGENVKENAELEAGAGFFAQAFKTPSTSLTYGLNFTSFFYDENLRRFSYGQGGYFSPQSYFAVSVPVDWQGVSGRMSYRLRGALGVQTFEEDASQVFPQDSALQAALVAFAAVHPDLDVVTSYPSQTSTGVGLNFGGQVEYLVAPNLSLGGQLSFDNARDYNETSVLGYLRYWFYPQGKVPAPPQPVQPYFDYQDPTQ